MLSDLRGGEVTHNELRTRVPGRAWYDSRDPRICVTQSGTVRIDREAMLHS